jgi:hypothetical protein
MKDRKIKSSISAVEPNLAENNLAKTQIITNNYLKEHKPYKWLNIPACVTNSVNSLLQWAIHTDESLLEYMLMNNKRLYKLQEQLNKVKKDHSQFKENS